MAYTTIDDPSAYFQTKTYTGTGNELVITNDGNSDLQPDFIWIKNRTVGYSHQLYDSSRGTTKALFSNVSNAETTVSNGLLTFNTDGFGVSSAAAVNENELVAWQWKANGGTTASNTDGSITSTVQVNQDAGFSIVTYTGTGANATVGHGLGVTPNIVFYKNRIDSGITGSTNGNWIVQSSALNVDEYIKLNENEAAATDTGYFRSTRPSSTVLTLGNYNSNNGSSDNLVAYCFAEKQGYSKFGKYTGNSNSEGNGTFVYTGFAPSFIIIKRIDAANDWIMHTYKLGTNNSNNIGNLNSAALRANETSAVDEWGAIDMLSNGFKIRTDAASENATSPYIYMAFADHPFVTSTGIPTTAR